MLAGLARDGGLYLPQEWPQFSKTEIAGLKGKPYREVAFRISRPFSGMAFDEMTGGGTWGGQGSAAIEAVRDRKTIDIFMLHPHGRVSEVQRRQMTTVLAPNVHNIAVRGTFDDCQDLAKACFNDLAFRDRHALTAVNSINFARVMAPIVYYFWAALKLGAPEPAVPFTVPTGHFGNVYAGYAAQRMGLPVSHFVVAANSNDILPRFFETGAMTM